MQDPIHIFDAQSCGLVVTIAANSIVATALERLGFEVAVVFLEPECEKNNALQPDATFDGAVFRRHHIVDWEPANPLLLDRDR